MNAMTLAKKYVKEKGHPVIVHANCVRMGSHSNSDRHELYRDEAEISEAVAQDPLKRFRERLVYSGAFTEEELDELDKKAKKEVSAAHKKVIASPDPDPSSIYDFVIPDPYIPEKFADGIPDGSGF